MLLMSLLLGTAGCGSALPLSGRTEVPAAAPPPSPDTPDRGPAATSTGTAVPISTAAPLPRRRWTVSLSGLATAAAVPPLPSSFAPPRPDSHLQGLLTQTLRGTAGTYSVVVHHLVDGGYAVVEPDEVHYAASLFKLAVLATAYRERDAGRLDFQRLLVLADKYVEYDLGTLALLGLEPEDRVSVEDAVKAMIVLSDTPLALMVQDAAGATRVEALLEAEGLADTSVMIRELPTTARDMAWLLETIAEGRGFAAASREKMLSLLLQASFRDGIPAGVPQGTKVAHKSGNWSNATHDVAIVWGPTGPYLLVVLSDQAWQWEPVVRLSEAVYQYFAAGPSPVPAASPPAVPSGR